MRNCTDSDFSNFRQHLALFDGALSLLIAFVALPIDAILTLAIALNKRFHSTFYLVLLNIVICDFLVASILCPLRAFLATKDFRLQQQSERDANAFKFIVLILSTTSTLGVTLLSADRLLSLKAPSRYRSLASQKVLAMLLFVWLPGFGLSPMCLYVDFNVLLSSTSFATATVGIALTAVTYACYKSNLRLAFDSAVSAVREDCTSADCAAELNKPNDQSSAGCHIVNAKTGPSKLNIKALSKQEPDYQVFQIEKRATKTFFWVMVVSLSFYAPVIGLSFYASICWGSCNSTALTLCIHLIISLISSSAPVRGILFMRRMTALRKAATDLFITQREAEERWRSESLASSNMLCREERSHSKNSRTRSESAIQAF